jgi:hypothetical protein
MQLLLGISFGAFVLSSLVVGARLLLLARRTRQVPELAIGVSLFAGGGVGYALVMLSLGLRVLPPAWTPIGLIAGSFFTMLGACALLLGIRSIFRSWEPWALRLVIGLCAVLVLSFLGRFLDPYVVPSPPWIFWTTTLAGGAAYGWSAFESLHYAQRLRRRVRLGLADAAMVRRFVLWGVSGLGAVGICVSSIVGKLFANGVPPAQMLVNSALGLTAAVCIWLAFFPRKRVRSARAVATRS